MLDESFNDRYINEVILTKKDFTLDYTVDMRVLDLDIKTTTEQVEKGAVIFFV